ncbi:hypothetical protein ACQZV8_17905 [Magnetococcales bacterium HHB-1]
MIGNIFKGLLTTSKEPSSKAPEANTEEENYSEYYLEGNAYDDEDSHAAHPKTAEEEEKQASQRIAEKARITDATEEGEEEEDYDLITPPEQSPLEEQPAPQIDKESRVINPKKERLQQTWQDQFEEMEQALQETCSIEPSKSCLHVFQKYLQELGETLNAYEAVLAEEHAQEEAKRLQQEIAKFCQDLMQFMQHAKFSYHQETWQQIYTALTQDDSTIDLGDWRENLPQRKNTLTELEKRQKHIVELEKVIQEALATADYDRVTEKTQQVKTVYDDVTQGIKTLITAFIPEEESTETL